MKSELIRLRERVQQLETALGQDNPDIAATFKLPTQRARLLGLLMAVPNATSALIENKLTIAKHSKVVLGRLRSDLKQYCERAGIPPITIHSKRDMGYWLDRPTKARIAAMMAPRVAPTVTASTSVMTTSVSTSEADPDLRDVMEDN